MLGKRTKITAHFVWSLDCDTSIINRKRAMVVHHDPLKLCSDRDLRDGRC